MAKMTVGMRRVLWEVALTGGRLPVDAADARSVRYSTRARGGNADHAVGRLIELGMIETYDADGVAMLRFTSRVPSAERERLADAAVRAAVECRSAHLEEGRAAERRLRAMIGGLTAAFAGPPAAPADFDTAKAAFRELDNLVSESYHVGIIDRWAPLEEVAPEHRPKLAHLYAPAAP